MIANKKELREDLKANEADNLEEMKALLDPAKNFQRPV
jgi:hypothetical protein